MVYAERMDHITKRKKSMNWGKTLVKAGLGFVTFVIAYLASNPALITNFIPTDYANMSIGGLITAGLTGLANWLKHKDDIT